MGNYNFKMKYFAFAALLGLSKAITLYSITGHPIYTEVDADQEMVQLGDFFHAGEHGQLGSGSYERVTPSRFSADSDDLFMRSMIQQYALEAKGEKDAPNEGQPTGVFVMNEATTRAAAAEVLNTHKGLSGAALASYLDTYFARSWAHFDVNRTGTIEVIKMPQFMRFLASDQYMSLGE